MGVQGGEEDGQVVRGELSLVDRVSGGNTEGQSDCSVGWRRASETVSSRRRRRAHHHGFSRDVLEVLDVLSLGANKMRRM